MMINALVYLTAAVICVPLARRLGLGSVLGYLLAGAAIGPWGLGFVRDVESILHFAEFGVVLMLFVIGLELETKRLSAMRGAVFGGGATRLDLLRAAGAGEARLLVNAIDDIDDSLALTDRVREHFPDLPIIARARNVSHYVALRTRGVNVVERETFESALRAGRHVLETLGIDRFRAREMADWFRHHNLATMDALVPHFSNESKVLSEAAAGREELRQFFARDRAQFETEHRSGWKGE